VTIALQFNTPQGTFIFDQKALIKMLVYVAVVGVALIVGLAALVFGVLFFSHVVVSLFLEACTEADRSGWLMQVLFLWFVGQALYRAIRFVYRAARAFLAGYDPLLCDGGKHDAWIWVSGNTDPRSLDLQLHICAELERLTKGTIHEVASFPLSRGA
jgi:hypothetical protein